MQRELDCSNAQSALRSVSSILGWTEERLAAQVAAFNWDFTPREDRDRLPFDDLLRRFILGSDRDWPSPTTIRWFHATRISADAQFAEGLLPTGLAQARLFGVLGKLAAECGFCSRQEFARVVRAGQNRAGKPWSSPDAGFDAGPHGFLVRDDVIENRRYYIEVPECVREICSRSDQFGYELLAAYRARTHPALVAFRSAQPGGSAMTTAIRYLYSNATGQDIEYSCGFDGEGATIPASDIIGVEWLGGSEEKLT